MDRTYRIGGVDYTKAHPQFAEALALAYAMRLRPRCMCRADGVEMYVSRIGDHYVLKRMPLSASRHAQHCATHDEVVEVRADSDFRDGAVEIDAVTGRANIALDVTLQPRALGVSVDQVSVASTAAAGPRRQRFSLAELVRFLWTEAGLDWWHPRFEGRRTWATVRSHLLRSAEGKFVERTPLASCLFIPEMFSVDRKAQIDENRRHRWFGSSSGARRTAGQPPAPARDVGRDSVRERRPRRLIMLAEVKAVPGHLSGDPLLLKHLPGIPFALTSAQQRSLWATYGREISLRAEGIVPHLLLVGTFEPMEREPLPFESLALLLATKQWLLANDHEDACRLHQLASRRVPFRAHPTAGRRRTDVESAGP